MLKEVQACPAMRRKATFKLASSSSPGVDYDVDVLLVQGHVTCTCPGFRFRGTCAHTHLVEERCGWQEGTTGVEEQTTVQAHSHVCPRCGSSTIDVVVPSQAQEDDDSEAAMRSRGVWVPPPPDGMR